MNENKNISAFKLWVTELKSPLVVAKIQNYFGVYRIERSVNQTIEITPRPSIKSTGYTTTTSNGCVQDVGQFNSTKDRNTLKINGNTCNGSLNLDSSKLGTELRYRHFRNISNASSIGSSSGDEVVSDFDSDTEVQNVDYTIDNMFWYYLFSFGASLGYELFYASFFPFWFWNIDGAVCRRVVNVWVFVMYIGQALKDVIRWPRPSAPPVVQLEPEYSQEYGMPSTHAMIAVGVPFSLLVFTMHRYEYPFMIGLSLALLWCILVCVSRLYLGMHTVLDIICGLILVICLLAIAFPMANMIDHFQITNNYAPLYTLAVFTLLAYLYPKSDRWTPARGDTTVIMATGAGFSTGSWLNYQLGIIGRPGIPPPYQIIWPDYNVIGLAMLRASIGILCIVATRAFVKSFVTWLVCFMMKLNPRDAKTKQKPIVELPSKFITYFCIGIVITYLCPFVFRLLSIERITMHTEV